MKRSLLDNARVKALVLGLAALGSTFSWLAPGVAAADAVRVTPSKSTIIGESLSGPAVSAKAFKTVDAVLARTPLTRAALTAQAATGKTVPFWTSTVTSPLNLKSYTTSMVGADPSAAVKLNTVIPYVPIVLRVHFANGKVLDPTSPLACTSAGAADTLSVTNRFFHSPLFTPTVLTSNGVNVAAGTSGVQLVDAFQRANFWSTAANTVYGVTLSPALATPQVVDVTAPAGSGTSTLSIRCGTSVKTVVLGQIEINAFDALIRQLAVRYATPAQLPVFLTYNIVQTEGGQCCILGYHNAVPTGPGTQTYAVGTFTDSGIFGGVDDILVWSHELAEWMDDPFVQAAVTGGGNDDVTPTWGHVGQVQGCQNNLEVGDPLSGTEYALAVGGFTYHFQDLAFADWFYRTKARGSGKKYSFMGNFAAPPAAC